MVATRRHAKVLRMVPVEYPPESAGSIVSASGAPVNHEPQVGVVLFMEVDTDAPDEDRVYRFFQTGQPIPERAEYVDTLPIGRAALHLYWDRDAKVPPDMQRAMDALRAAKPDEVSAATPEGPTAQTRWT